MNSLWDLPDGCYKGGKEGKMDGWCGIVVSRHYHSKIKKQMKILMLEWLSPFFSHFSYIAEIENFKLEKMRVGLINNVSLTKGVGKIIFRVELFNFQVEVS